MQVAKAKSEPIDLWDFSRIVTNETWEPRPYLNLIIELLHYCMNGQIENLAVSLSPRLGKSWQISNIFPAYILGNRPYAKIILVSYDAELVRGFGANVKDYLDTYGYLFPLKPTLSKDTKGKGFFKIRKTDEIQNPGEFYCNSTNGGVLGHGGHWIIVDDPTKNIEEAQSERHQEKLLQLFNTAISSRRERDPVTGQKAVTIVTHQRLDQNDLIGTLTKNRKWISAEEALIKLRKGEKLGATWVYLRLPELAEENDILGREPGEPLHPEERDRNDLLQIKKDIGEYEFNCIHQQDPKPREGNYFQDNYFEVVDYLPNNIIQEVQWADLAATSYPENTPISLRGAATAVIRLALTQDRRIFITYMDEMWEEDDVVMTNILQSARLGGKKLQNGNLKKYCVPQDPGGAGKGQAKKYSLQMPGYLFEGIIEPRNMNKEQRAVPFSNWAKVNKVYIYNKAPGPNMMGLKIKGKLVYETEEDAINRYKKVCTAFPGGRHKDFIDASSGAFGEFDIPDEGEKAIPFDPRLMGAAYSR
ncbi:hypothetical protein [Methanobacterium paludis]|nr:hypothetical protein [Methanobacterium paludis]